MGQAKADRGGLRGRPVTHVRSDVPTLAMSFKLKHLLCVSILAIAKTKKKGATVTSL